MAKLLLPNERLIIAANNTGSLFDRAIQHENTLSIIPTITDRSAIQAAWFDITSKLLYVLRPLVFRVFDTAKVDIPQKGNSVALSAVKSLCVANGKSLISNTVKSQLRDSNLVLLKEWVYSSSNQNNGYAFICKDGSRIIKTKDDDVAVVEVVNTSDFTVTHTLATVSSRAKSVYLSPDGLIAIYPTSTSVLKVQDLVANTETAAITTGTSYNWANCSFVDTDNSDYVLYSTGHSNGANLLLIKLSTGAIAASLSTGKKAICILTLDETHVILNSTTGSRVYAVNTTAETLVEVSDTNHSGYFSFPKLAGVAPYKHEDSIVETLYTDQFDVVAYGNDDTVHSRTIEVAGAISIPLQTAEPLTITVTPRINKGVWGKDRPYIIGDLGYSNDPSNVDWVFKCVVAGTSGSVPPIWQTTAGTQFADGTVTWEAVEPISNPITKSPIIPIPA